MTNFQKPSLREKIIWKIEEMKGIDWLVSPNTQKLYDNLIELKPDITNRSNIKEELLKYKTYASWNNFIFDWKEEDISGFYNLINWTNTNGILQNIKWHQIAFLWKITKTTRKWWWEYRIWPMNHIDNIIDLKYIHSQAWSNELKNILLDPNNIIELFLLKRQSSKIKITNPKILVKKILLQPSSFGEWFVFVKE